MRSLNLVILSRVLFLKALQNADKGFHVLDIFKILKILLKISEILKNRKA